jgi:hypothetical protein
MPLTVNCDGSGPVIVSNKTAFSMLSPDLDFCDLFERLHTKGFQTVTLRDGREAIVTLPEYDRPLPERDAQRSLALVPATVQHLPFEVECQIMIPIEATVECSARNRLEAQRMVHEVISGVRSAPVDFHVKIDVDQVGAKFRQMARRDFNQGAVAGLDVHSVRINRIEER